jgi:nucleotide-binding universal stress UspA family protein
MLGPADRILVATDFSPDGDKALACAGELARRFGAETVVLHVHPGEAARAVGLEDLLPGRLAACLSAMRDRGLPVRGLVRRGDPAIEILEAAVREQASLIVLGAHGEASTRGVLLGSVADRVLRRATIPLLVVRSDGSADRTEQPGGGAGDQPDRGESEPRP